MESLNEDVSGHVLVAQSVTCPRMELAIYMVLTEIYLISIEHNFAIEIDKDGNKTIIWQFKRILKNKRINQYICVFEAQ